MVDPEVSNPGEILPRPSYHRGEVEKAPGSSLVRGLVVLFAVYLFIAAINLMGHGLKTVAEEPDSARVMDDIFKCVDHPLAGLCVGILITSLVQSSSFTTSFTVTLVATGSISLPAAIPIIMGANIGTSVTNLLVSLAHIRRRREFRRSLAGAIVHDFFNVLSVTLILPLEIAFGVVSRPAIAIAQLFSGSEFSAGDPKKFNIVKIAVKPFAKAADWLLVDLIGFAPTVAGLVTAVLAILMLFTALFLLVKMLRGLMKDRLSNVFSRTVFRNPAIAFITGMILTAAVQSSSVTTSLIVPLVGAGILTLKQIYPFTLGANVGTTVTAMMSGIAVMAIAAGQGSQDIAYATMGLAVALGHLIFNCYGIMIFWPLGWIPISLAKAYAALASRRRILMAAYLILLFFLLPVVVIYLVNR